MIAARDPSADWIFAAANGGHFQSLVQLECNAPAANFDIVAVVPFARHRALLCKVEEYLSFMLACCDDFILYREPPVGGIQLQASSVSHRIIQAGVPVVLAAYTRNLLAGLPVDSARYRTPAPQKRSQHFGLVLTVDDDGVVRTGAAEIFSPVRLAEIVIRPRIDQHVQAESA